MRRRSRAWLTSLSSSGCIDRIWWGLFLYPVYRWWYFKMLKMFKMFLDLLMASSKNIHFYTVWVHSCILMWSARRQVIHQLTCILLHTQKQNLKTSISFEVHGRVRQKPDKNSIICAVVPNQPVRAFLHSQATCFEVVISNWRLRSGCFQST